MIYVALLRGINVGGNNKIEMKKLKEVMERDGFRNVSTYINSGNIFFEDKDLTRQKLVEKFEKLITDEFGLTIKVLLKMKPEIESICTQIPSEWKNDKDMKSDVMFLWEGYDSESVLDSISINPEVDTVKYVPGVILWSLMKSKYNKSNMNDLIKNKLYKQMTVRNVNTVRKLLEIMEGM
jgi:uncharacterized protein (DUF1697 family)